MAWARRDANGALISNGVPVWEDGASVVSAPTQLDFRHGLDVTASAGGAQVAVDESELMQGIKFAALGIVAEAYPRQSARTTANLANQQLIASLVGLRS